MKIRNLSLMLIISTIIISCGSNEAQQEAEIEKQTNDILKELLSTDEPSFNCDSYSIKDFNTFLGLNYGDTEDEIKAVLGKETEAKFTTDRSQYQYYFKDTKRVPVTVSTNPKDGKVETVFIEVLGTGANFNQDILKAEEDFNVEPCFIDLFGKKPKEVLKLLGQANSDNMKESAQEEGVRTLTYLSEDTFTMVTFKFYPSQDNLLSSMTVNWFYEPVKS